MDATNQVQKDQLNTAEESSEQSSKHVLIKRKGVKRRGIFLSYCSASDFFQIKFVLELTNQLQEIGFARDLWIDINNVSLASFHGPTCLISRLEVAEKCKAAIVVLSDAYFNCKRCKVEYDSLRLRQSRHTFFRLFSINYSMNQSGRSDLFGLDTYCHVDLCTTDTRQLSCQEKVVTVLKTFTEYLEIYSSGTFKESTPCTGHGGEINFQSKTLLSWTTSDVLDWLRFLAVHEKSIMLFEELEITGLLLPFLTSHILHDIFALDTKVTHRRIMSSVEQFQLRNRTDESSHWSKLQAQRGKSQTVYLIYDPSDKRLAELIKDDMKQRGLKVLSHGKLGQSREEFLMSNSSELAKAETMVVLLTKAAHVSPFVYHEVLLSIWLDRKIISMIFHPVIDSMRISMRAMLGTRASINFHANLYRNAFEVLVHELKGNHANRSVIFEQDFLQFVSNNVKSLEDLISPESGIKQTTSKAQSYIFFSYHWDYQAKVHQLTTKLQTIGISCLSDMDFVTKSLHSTVRPKVLQSEQTQGTKTLSGAIEEAITNATVVVLCVSRKYLQCPQRANEIVLANRTSRILIPVLMEWMQWPPINATVELRKIFALLDCIDLSTDRAWNKNIHELERTLITKLDNKYHDNSNES